MIDDKIAQPLLHLVCWGLHPQSLPTSLPDSIGNGLYRVTLPDGQQVIVDQYGNIIG